MNIIDRAVLNQKFLVTLLDLQELEAALYAITGPTYMAEVHELRVKATNLHAQLMDTKH